MRLPTPKRFFVETWGCQMNELDSGIMTSLLEQRGMVEGEESSADLIIFNTCSVRDLAERKALGKIGIASPEERLKSYPHQFSGGMRQRVSIAIAMLHKPDLIIADEPTTALDVTIQGQILYEMQKLCRETATALIWITHDLAVIAELADRIIVMYAGFIVEEADVFQLFSNPLHPYTLSLLKSIPRVDKHIDDRLATISGFPPDNLRLTRLLICTTVWVCCRAMLG